jgi:hypothetical protein
MRKCKRLGRRKVQHEQQVMRPRGRIRLQAYRSRFECPRGDVLMRCAYVPLEPGASHPSTKVAVARIRDKYIPLWVPESSVLCCFAAEVLQLRGRQEMPPLLFWSAVSFLLPRLQRRCSGAFESCRETPGPAAQILGPIGGITMSKSLW